MVLMRVQGWRPKLAMNGRAAAGARNAAFMRANGGSGQKEGAQARPENLAEPSAVVSLQFAEVSDSAQGCLGRCSSAGVARTVSSLSKASSSDEAGSPNGSK
jgi:hypothetical protein